jgi:hypothetical protein
LLFIIASLLISGAVSTPAQAQEPSYSAITDAIYAAEGGRQAIKPFGVLSVPCSDYADCRRVCYNTVRNNHRRWIKAGRPGEYLRFLQKRYAPIGAENDPKNLNDNWYRNVKRGLT